MNAEFDLLKLEAKKDELTGRINPYESTHYKIALAIVASVMVSLFTLHILDFNLPGWAEFFMSAGVVIFYTYAFLALFFSRNAGKVSFSEKRIIIEPKKESHKFPDSPIAINEDTEINIYTIQASKIGISRALLHMQVSNGDSNKNLGLILKNKKKIEQYLEVLESWYRAGYDVKEFDQMGNHVFKLDQGKSYADIQKIKAGYGISW